MRLREQLNQNKLAQKINGSEIGRAFENSDFAFATEMIFRTYNHATKDSSKIEKAIIAPFYLGLSPMIQPLFYTITKLSRWLGKGNYQDVKYEVLKSFGAPQN